MLTRILTRSISLGGVALVAAACVVAPPPGEPIRPRAEMLGSDTRATRYGSTAAEVLAHPMLRDKAQAMFGADWAAGPGSRLTRGAPEFFSRSEPPRMIRVGGAIYLAVAGCAVSACATQRGLLLIRDDGGELLARVDEGGYSHYYAHRPDASVAPVTRALIDGAWLAVVPVVSGAAPPFAGA